MTEILIGAGVLALVIGGFIAHDALRRPGDEPAPEQPQNADRTRPQSEAYAAGARHDQLSEKDAAAAAELTAWQQEISAEQPIVLYAGTRSASKRTYVRRDIGRRVAAADRHIRAYLAAHKRFVADPLRAPLPAADRAAPVLSSVPAVEPEWSLGGFTEGWGTTTADIDRMVAEAKAGAK